jgi:DNA-binding transcriptional LysR family regulator
MQDLDEQGVCQGRHAVGVSRRTFREWESARVFLEVARQGSLRGAARELSLSTEAVRNRIEELERALGTTLLVRGVSGVRVTQEGQVVYASAERMERETFRLMRASDQQALTAPAEVRLSVSEGLGTFWVTPRLIEFQRANPGILVTLDAVLHTADISRMEADVAIGLRKPTLPDLRTRKLGRLHLVPFAAPAYLETFGRPKTAADLLDHRIVIHVDNAKEMQAAYDRLFPGIRPEGFVAFRTNVGSAYYWALAQGAGIGLLPTYACALGAPLVPLDLDIRLTVDIWMAYHAEMKRTARVGRLIEWVVQSFEPRKFPWFRDEFIHPNELQAAYHGEPLASLFSGFLGR